MPPPRENAHNLVVCPPKVTKLKTYKLPIDAYKIWEFHKNCANELPLSGKFMAKNRNFDSFVFPHFCRDKREILYGGVDLPAMCRLCGAKNLFLDYWIKTIQAWLRFAQACRKIWALLDIVALIVVIWISEWLANYVPVYRTYCLCLPDWQTDRQTDTVHCIMWPPVRRIA